MGEESVYGKKIEGTHYKLPEEIQQLFQLEEELQKQDLSLSQIGLIPDLDNTPYFITPPDLIPFASTGGDGIHFGFLTDFSTVPNLEEAPIVCVTPTNDPPIRYIARNIREFLQLAYSVPYVELLEMIWELEEEAQVEEALKEFYEYDDPSFAKERKEIYKYFQQTFQLEEISVLSYIQEVKKERKEKIVIPTVDGLGIVASEKQEKAKTYSFKIGEPLTNEELENMKKYLHTANPIEKLAFLRDVHFFYILTPNEDKDLYHLCLEILESLGLYYEKEQMLKRDL